MGPPRRLALALACVSLAACLEMPPPFTRELELRQPPLSGPDVVVLQHLLARGAWAAPAQTGAFDSATAAAVAAAAPGSKGRLDAAAARSVLERCGADGYADDGRPAAARGRLYKLHVAVSRDRSREATATLLDAKNAVLVRFTARLHGADELGERPPWPSYSDTPGLTQLAPDGNTPTGLYELDLNAPEPNATLYGPFPVNRAVVGLEGNARFLLPHLRNGILVHTGAWPGWTPGTPMPNSEGCIHAGPEDVEAVWRALEGLGVEVRPNTGGALPYPYTPQGLLSVEEVPAAA